MDDLGFEAVEADEFEITLPITDQYGSQYQSPREAARVLGLRASQIKAVLAGKLQSVGGFRFQFA